MALPRPSRSPAPAFKRRAVGVIIAISVVGAASTGAAIIPTATAAGDGRTIAFASQRDVAGPSKASPHEIYIINEDGSGLERLTTHPADDMLPAWSPDGKRLAWTSKRTGNYEIFVADFDEASRSLTNVTQLTNNFQADRFPAWSPDGETLVFMSARARNGNFEIFKMDLTAPNPDATATQMTFVPGTEDCCPDVSPDGTTLVFQSLASGDFEIYTMPLHGPFIPTNITNRTPSGSAAWTGYDGTPTWTPEGKILYRSLREDNWYRNDVYEIDPTTRTSTQITNGSGARQPQSSQAGDKIVYTNGATGNDELWLFSRSSASSTLLASAPGDDRDASWRPDPNGPPPPPPSTTTTTLPPPSTTTLPPPGGGDDVDPNGRVATPNANQTVLSPVPITGTATDDVGVAAIKVAIRNRATGSWWNGNDWQPGFSYLSMATLDSPGASSTDWSFAWDAPGPGQYALMIRADDTAGNFDQNRPWVKFDVGSVS